MSGSQDSSGNLYDNTGRNYTTPSGQPATHGQSVGVNDGYGNYQPGYMNNGTAVPSKKD